MFQIFVYMSQKRKTSLLYLFVAFFIICNYNFSYSQANRYVVLKGGFGLPFGAYGLNLEYRYYHIGGYIGCGYMKNQYYKEVSIPSSYNAALGLKYYFFRFEDPWHPILGIHAGWLNNYYHKNIGDASYNSTVYGLALIGGVELTENFVSLEMSMVVDPGFAILHPERHPYYKGKAYFTPTIGVGVNLYAMHHYYKYREKNKRKKEEIENSQIADSENKSEKNKNENAVFIEKIKSECNDTISFPAVRILIPDNYGNLIAGKQIADDTYLFVRFSSEKSSSGILAQVFQIDSNITDLNVFIIKTTKPNQSLLNLAYQFASDNQTDGVEYDAVKGTVSFYYYKNARNEISIKINDLKLEGKNEVGKAELYYDEIFICLVAEKK
jgi:hypothetical protein